MGGLERGLERAGFNIKVAAYVEIEAFIIANLVAAMEKNKLGPAPIWTDVKTFPYRGFYKKIHGITAGYPCQPFSVAGKRKGTNDARHLWPYIFRIVQSVKPVWCFFENVEGHLSLGFDEVSRDLRRMGYFVEAGLFSAEEVGAPHRRKRLFIFAMHMEYANATKIKRELFRIATQKPNIGNTSKMANTGIFGSRKSCNKKFTKLINKNGQKWPAKPGQKQYKWESPRTIEPGMGCTIDGYNFRIDLLRMLGNGVVEQTAEKAIIYLLRKMFKI